MIVKEETSRFVYKITVDLTISGQILPDNIVHGEF